MAWIKNKKWSSLGFVLAVGLVLLVLSWGSFSHQFLSDDFEWVHEARVNVEQGTWFQPFQGSIGGDFYRPLVVLGFEVDYALFGFNPTGYYIHQFLFHFLLVFLVVCLVYLLFKRRRLAYLTGLVFALWPAQHEVVSWLSGRPDLYAATFSMLALVLWVYTLQRSGKKKWIAFGCSFFAAAAAYVSKEQSAVLPGLMALILILVVKKNSFRVYGKAVWLLALHLVLLVGAILLRGHILGDIVGGYSSSGDYLATTFTLDNVARPFISWMYIVNWGYLSAEFSGAFMRAAHALFVLGVRLWYVVALMVLGGGLLLWRKQKHASSTLLYVLGIIWSLIAFIPVYTLSSSINESLGNTRFLFFSSIGYAMVIAALLTWIFDVCKIRKTIPYITAAAVCVVLAGLWHINAVPWQSASDRVADVMDAMRVQHNEITRHHPTDLIVGDLPTAVYNAYAFYRLHSIKEAAYIAGYTTETVNQYGSVKPWPGPFCDRSNASAIQAIFWDGSVKKFTEISDATLKKLSKPQDAITWDFTSLDAQNDWEVKGAPAQWTIEGLEFINDGSAYVVAKNWPAVFLGAFRYVNITFDVLSSSKSYGSRTLTMQWSSNGVYTHDTTIEYPVKDASTIQLKIQACSYSNWMLSDQVSSFRFRPLAKGTVVVRQVTLVP